MLIKHEHKPNHTTVRRLARRASVLRKQRKRGQVGQLFKRRKNLHQSRTGFAPESVKRRELSQ